MPSCLDKIWSRSGVHPDGSTPSSPTTAARASSLPSNQRERVVEQNRLSMFELGDLANGSASSLLSKTSAWGSFRIAQARFFIVPWKVGTKALGGYIVTKRWCRIDPQDL